MTLSSQHPDHAWYKLAQAALRDDDLESIIHRTEDGIIRGPLWTQDDLPKEIRALARTDVPCLDDRPWHIAAPVTGPKISDANSQILDDLKGGASALRLTLGETGLTIKNTSDAARLLEGVHTELVPISFAPSPENKKTALILLESDALKRASINLGLDPAQGWSQIEGIISDCPSSWRAITCSTAHAHDSGATPALELAILAARIANTMRRLGPERASRHMTLELCVNQDTHQNIAKLRAARQIYARIASAFELEDFAAPLHAVTSLAMMQSIDPWTNMLRVISAGFGAALGGADYTTTRPFTDALTAQGKGEATELGHRAARNTQLLMMTESRLGHVADPAFGSYYHEGLTQALAQKAWSKFQSIEAQGGIEPYLNNGQYSVDLEQARQARAQRAESILGVNLHAAEDVRAPKLRARS